MNNFQEDELNTWKTKLQLAQEGNAQAIEEVKNQVAPHIDSDHPFATANYAHLLKQASLRLIDKGQTYGSYEVHSKVPKFFLLQGKAGIQCINTEGDNDIICSTIGSGMLELSETELKIKYGESNIALITQFEVIAQEKSVILEFATKAMQTVASTQAEVTLRQEAIMRKYMLIALKHITKFTYSKDKPILSKFYLLQGRACFISKKGKYILCCYQEGFFSPKHLNDDNISLYIFEGAYIMLLQEEMLKDEVVAGLQAKRQEHIFNIQSRYEKMSNQQRQKVQQLLIDKYCLNRSQIERDILGIEKPVQKFMKSKNDFIRTSSSMKDKCGIRIRKAKKTN